MPATGPPCNALAAMGRSYNGTGAPAGTLAPAHRSRRSGPCPRPGRPCNSVAAMGRAYGVGA